MIPKLLSPHGLRKTGALFEFIWSHDQTKFGSTALERSFLYLSGLYLECFLSTEASSLCLESTIPIGGIYASGELG